MIGLSRTGVTTILLGFALLLVPSAAQAGMLDQQQVDTTNCATVIGPTLTGAQSFTAGLAGNLDQVDVFFAFLNANPGALTVQIEGVTTTMSGDIPNGTVLATETVATPIAGWNSVILSPTVPVSVGTRYTIVLSASAEVGSWMGSASLSNAYSAGNPSFNGGNGWAVSPGGCDQAFKTYVAQATAVRFDSASAVRTAKGVLVHWRTGSEVDTLGFHVYRQTAHKRVKLTRHLVPARGSIAGAKYTYRDRRAPRVASLRYWIQVVGTDGSRTWKGPIRVRARSRT
jgi:hypothetical protein